MQHNFKPFCSGTFHETMEKVVVVGILQNTIIVADNDEDNMDRENDQGMSDNKRRKLRELHLIYFF